MGEVVSFLSLGSNLGKREENIKRALDLLRRDEDIKIVKTSSLYETEPVGSKAQGWFLNQVIKIETNLLPQNLLKVIKKVEKEVGRVRGKKWGARIIDIDIILYGGKNLATKELTIPHPQLRRRKFVLIPLVEIAPRVTCFKGETASYLLKSLRGGEEVRLYKDASC
ncbi:MAG: 2-amino-4-hydroxy-6-hydroxymethyldihydropteridine diphosphokinase [Armatimonadetes bacterium CG07_land_8_20_14_0_80_40_9]|nr:MAG: 2-amino-4-hydroxy-6-hydroxymethyldihydropteridine diphosphokinase [Armatimonadetes bacterium CG07_land_8_20_14_0_80_40_9]